jgi:hypothetical protein
MWWWNIQAILSGMAILAKILMAQALIVRSSGPALWRCSCDWWRR